MNFFIIISVVLLFLVGLAGIVLPVLPGIGLIYSGILLYALYFGVETVGKVTLMALGGVAALSLVIDYLASAYGAKRSGASGWGSLGAIAGGLLGFLVLNVPGLIAGIFLGAIFGEGIVAKKDWEASLRAGVGSLLGFLGGTLLKLLIAFGMIGFFIARILF